MSAAGSSGIGQERRGPGRAHRPGHRPADPRRVWPANPRPPSVRTRRSRWCGCPPCREAELLAVPSPMADLPAGTSFGTLVHAVLETTDPQAPDLAAELRDRCAEQIARRGALFTADQLVRACSRCCTRRSDRWPAGSRLPGSRSGTGWRRWTSRFPWRAATATEGARDGWRRLGGAGQAAGSTGGGAAPGSRSVRSRPSCADTSTRRPARRVRRRLARRATAANRWRGYLTGSLDLVIRLPGRAIWSPTTRRTGSRLAAPGPDCSGLALRPARADRSVMRVRLPAAGAAVLRCVASVPALAAAGLRPCAAPRRGAVPVRARACAGPATPVVDGRPCGVFGWQPPAGLVTALSDLLDSAGGGS